MEYTEIIYEKADRVATITFNRPQALNAYTPTLGLELKTALHEADADNQIGAIIVTGAGRSFCSGFDVKVGAQANKALRAGESKGYSEIYDNFDYMHQLGTPIIGAINGHCVFMGFAMTLFFDFRSSPTMPSMARYSRRRGWRWSRARDGCSRGWSASRARWIWRLPAACCRRKKRCRSDWSTGWSRPIS